MSANPTVEAFLLIGKFAIYTLPAGCPPTAISRI